MKYLSLALFVLAVQAVPTPGRRGFAETNNEWQSLAAILEGEDQLASVQGWSWGWWHHSHTHHGHLHSATVTVQTTIAPTSTVSVSLSTSIPEPTSSILPSSTVTPISTPTFVASTVSASASATITSAPTASQLAYLDPQNTIRATKGAVPFTWNNTLAEYAQTWANKCVFQHSGGPYGENISAGTETFTPAAGIKLWTDEESSYDPSNPTASHYTQVVWKASTQLGCAVAVCNDLLGANTGDASFYVCEYQTAGNVLGEFAANVEA